MDATLFFYNSKLIRERFSSGTSRYNLLQMAHIFNN